MWERTLSQKLVRLFCEQKVVDESKDGCVCLWVRVAHYRLVVSVLLVILVSAVCGDCSILTFIFELGLSRRESTLVDIIATSHTRCYLAFTGLALICILPEVK